MANATKTTACPTGHMTYTQAPAACEKNIFHLFRFAQPVKNYSFFCVILVPMDLDVTTKAVVLGSCFLIVSTPLTKTNVYLYISLYFRPDFIFGDETHPVDRKTPFHSLPAFLSRWTNCCGRRNFFVVKTECICSSS